MRQEQVSDRLHPMVEIYDRRNSSLPSVPQYLLFKDTYPDRFDPYLIIEVGRVNSESGGGRLPKPRSGIKPHTLVIAILDGGNCFSQMDPVGRTEPIWVESYSAFDCIFTTKDVDSHDFIRRLSSAIIGPGAPGNTICCDWNDLRTIVKSAGGTTFGAYGFGSSVGTNRAANAVCLAIDHLRLVEKLNGPPSGMIVVMRTAPGTLLGREIKEVTQHAREHGAFGTSITHCVQYDETLAEGVLEVDLFTFGRSLKAGFD